jgi:hypothetical protein
MSNGTSQGSFTTPATPVPHGDPQAVVGNLKRPAEAEETRDQRRKRINNIGSQRYHARKKKELADALDKIKRLEAANMAMAYENAALRDNNDKLWETFREFQTLGRVKASMGDETPDGSSEHVGIGPGGAHPEAGQGEQEPHQGAGGSNHVG